MPEIFLVMRKPGNIRVLCQALEGHGYTCTGISDKKALEARFEQPLSPDLALVDVSGFGESVWSMCELLQHKDVPFIVLSAKQELGLSSQTLRYGAASILEKPIVKTSLLKLIENMAHASAR
ncbi:response regulator [Nitrosococcus wardiae]|uniref:Response regulator n=1 Tax=Nitrosococcus wardiae TaxID=1814290 RepID=A0A4P7C4Q3_9GAMM|nr:response regulator [Nitrosococcus wardiae]QBQ55916.1 response regulator [Nitrosococcus wardiae]